MTGGGGDDGGGGGNDGEGQSSRRECGGDAMVRAIALTSSCPAAYHAPANPLNKAAAPLAPRSAEPVDANFGVARMSLGALATAVIVPPLNLLPLGLAGLALAWRWPRLGRVLVAVSLIGLTVFSLPVTSRSLIASLEWGRRAPRLIGHRRPSSSSAATPAMAPTRASNRASASARSRSNACAPAR